MSDINPAKDELVSGQSNAFRHIGESVLRGLPQGCGNIPSTTRIGRSEPD